MERKKTDRRLKRGKRQSKLPAPGAASIVRLDIHREIDHITQCAQTEDARIVRVGNLVLFSTQSRDAWLLDVEDDFAICVCRDGEPQSVRIVNSPGTFAIEWTADFTIDDGAFIVKERSGRVVAIQGYPVAAIAAACR